MIENQKIRPARVIGPLGEPLTLESLPPPNTTRWVVRRKAEVVAAVNGGLQFARDAFVVVCRNRRNRQRGKHRGRRSAENRTSRHSGERS